MILDIKDKMNFKQLVLVMIILTCGYIALDKYMQTEKHSIINMNNKISPLIEELIQTKFFRIIRLNINQECHLGTLQKLCKSKSCSVCRCDINDIPQIWSNTDRVKMHSKGQDLWGNERNKTIKQWVWHVEDETNDKGQYFDICTNIQSYSGYNGSYIWYLIYKENCFQNTYGILDNVCEQERILYKIISGLHTSISTHLSRFYKHIQSNDVWADLNIEKQTKFHFNHSEYKKRVLDHPQRIENLHFLHKILAKSIKQATPYLKNNLVIQSGNISQDLKAEQLLASLLKQLQNYDLTSKQKDSLKFFTPDNPKVKQYQKYIHNISDILNCVECQKCRLFGKMQTYGIGTALKILLGYPSPYKRNEIVALFNVFNKISMSIDTYYKQGVTVTLNNCLSNKEILQLYILMASVILLILLFKIKEKQNKNKQE